MEYIQYNREERDLCAHLFRLLLEDQPNWGPLKEFLKKEEVKSPRVYCEVAIIRDAYFARKPNTRSFVSSICDLIAKQNEVSEYTPFNDLPDPIKDPAETHPKQIKQKLEKRGMILKEADIIVYGTLQAMFNAKPDLVICEGGNIFVYEAKYTMDFDDLQLDRTRQIVEVWAKLLYADLGFDNEPSIEIRTLGLTEHQPDISWEYVEKLAQKWWSEDDFSVRVLSKVHNIN